MKKSKIIAALERLKEGTSGVVAATISDCISTVKSTEDADLWIPTAERLPDMHQRVLICREKEVGQFLVEQGYLEPGGWWKVYGTRVKSVAYWTPLPEAPNE